MYYFLFFVGPVRFYLMPWQRDAERARIAKMVALEAELDIFKDEKKNEQLTHLTSKDNSE